MKNYDSTIEHDNNNTSHLSYWIKFNFYILIILKKVFTITKSPKNNIDGDDLEYNDLI